MTDPKPLLNAEELQKGGSGLTGIDLKRYDRVLMGLIHQMANEVQFANKYSDAEGVMPPPLRDLLTRALIPLGQLWRLNRMFMDGAPIPTNYIDLSRLAGEAAAPVSKDDPVDAGAGVAGDSPEAESEESDT